MARMICNMCGEEVERGGSRQKYCTPCSKLKVKEQQRAYRKDPDKKERANELNREWKNKNKVKVRESSASYYKRKKDTVIKKYREDNKERINRKAREYHSKNRDLDRGYHYKKKYGISIEDYNALLFTQGGMCAICKKSICPTGLRLCVDHCHSTGEVRGILCNHCNRALGLFKDNTQSLREAIVYLERTSNREGTGE